MKTFIQLILIGIVIMCFSRCYNSQKATEQVNKAYGKYPEIVAKLARDKYPCTQLLKTDTALVFKDTTIFIDCPDSNYNIVDYGTIITDTIYQPGERRMIKVPVKIQLPSKVITRWFEDGDKLKIAAVMISGLNTDLAKVIAKNDEYKARSDHRGKENWIWRIIASFFIILWVWRKYKQLTTIKVT